MLTRSRRPVNPCSSRIDALFKKGVIADSNMQHRMRTMERGGDAACPECYKVFAQGIGGGYILAKEISTI